MPSDRPIWGSSRAPRTPHSESGIGGRRPSPPRSSSTEWSAPPSPPPQKNLGATEGGYPLSHSSSSRSTPKTRRRRPSISISYQHVLAGFTLLLAVVVGVVVVRSSGSSNSPTAVSDSSVSKGSSSASTTPVEPNTSAVVGNSEWDTVARSVVYIEATGSRCGWTGSGSIVGDGSYVLTNQHVSGDGECDLAVWLTDSTTAVPTKYVRAEVIKSDSSRDLAVIQMRDSDGQPFIDTSREPMKFSSTLPKLGDKLTILGYPGIGGSTITLTSGDFSGVDKSESYDYLKTTANMNPGVSGGAAFNAKGELVGIPTAGRGAEIACDSRSDCVANGSTIGLLRPVGLAEDLLSRINR
jgi:S1-C subfamily serine protease